MPHKGFFTQSAIVLLDGAVPIDEVERALLTFDIVARKPRGDGGWLSGSESLILPLREEVNGYIAVDVLAKPWPDDMGDPKANPELFAAWSMGHFGPFAFPKALARAAAQNRSVRDVRERLARHRGFVRVRSSYVFGADKDAPVMPADYEPVHELERVTDVAVALLELPRALCYFNPNGETLHTAESVMPIRDHYRRLRMPPLDLWANVRVWNLEDAAKSVLVDCVGMQQLDLPDHEAVYPRGTYPTNDVAMFVRNVSLYLAQNGPVIKDGETTDGPGGRWRARHLNEPAAVPPRPVMRWRPPA